MERFVISPQLEKRIITVENILIKEIAEEELGINLNLNQEKINPITQILIQQAIQSQCNIVKQEFEVLQNRK